MLLDRLLEEKSLRAPRGQGALHRVDGGLADELGGFYREQNGVVDLFNDYERDLSHLPPPHDFVAAVARQWGFDPGDDTQYAAIEGAIRATLLVPENSNLRAEVREFASRMKIPEPEGWPPTATAVTKAEHVAANPQIEVVRHYLPAALPACTREFYSFRIRNVGLGELSSTRTPPFRLSYHWTRAQGELRIFEGERATLPRDLAPGDEMTVMVPIATPAEPGEYVLQLRPLEEMLCWHEDQGGDYRVSIQPTVAHAFDDLSHDDAPFDIAEDIAAAERLVAQALPRRERRWRVLEIAGGAFPVSLSACAVAADVVSVDISFALCQLGALIAARRGLGRDHLQFLAADACSLPFAPGTFDALVICAALHHFPDPTALLACLRLLLAPDGVLVVVREPCNPNPFDVDYLRDIGLGINEQQWNLREYGRIFTEAGFRPERTLVRSRCSLSTWLRPAQAPHPERCGAESVGVAGR